MEDKRVKILLERVINFNWAGPRPSALRAEHEEQNHKLYDLWRESADESEKAKLWSELNAPAPATVRAEYDEFKKLRWEFKRALRRDFPEWHYSDGPHVRQFVGGEGNSERDIQPELRKVWKLASTGEADKAKRELRKMSERYTRKAEAVLETTFSWSGRETNGEAVVRLRPREPQPKDAATLRQMVETLEWLQRRLGSLKVCENPKCASGKNYFFKVYPNDRYCCDRCIAKAKALRKAKREAESQKPPRQYIKSADIRENMSIGQTERWARNRAKTGKPKYGRSSKPQ